MGTEEEKNGKEAQPFSLQPTEGVRPKVKNKIFNVQDNRVVSAKKLKTISSMIHTNTFIQMNHSSSLARGGITLSNNDYKTLQGNQPLALGCINFLVELLSKKRTDIQFITFSTANLISHNLVNIKKNNIIGVIHEFAQYSLVIINLKKQTTTFIDLTMKLPPDTMLHSFLKLLEQHNTVFKKNIPLEGWTNTKMEYPNLRNGMIVDLMSFVSFKI